MDEETKTEVKEVAQQQGLNLVEQATLLRDEIRAENDRREAILKQEQELHAIQMLSGHAQAGQAPVQISEEERIKAETRLLFKGTQIEKAIK